MRASKRKGEGPTDVASSCDNGDDAPCTSADGDGVSSPDRVVTSPSSQTIVNSPTVRLYLQHSRNSSTVFPRRASIQPQSSLGTTQPVLPKSFYLISIFTLLCVLMILLSILVPMMVIHNAATSRSVALREYEYSTSVEWVTVLRNVMIDGLAAGRALEGYAISAFPDLQSTGAVSSASRSANVSKHLNIFTYVASLLSSKRPAVAMQAICPGGVITTMHPFDKKSVNRDLLNASDPANQYRPTPMETIESGRYSIVGPRRSTIDYLRGIWVLITRIPIYKDNKSSGVGGSTALRSLENFWGFVFLLVNVSKAIDVIQLHTMARNDRLNYVLYDNSTDSGGINVIASTLPPATTQEVYNEFIADSTVSYILSRHSPLRIAVRSRESYTSLTPANVTSIVLWTLFGGLLLLGVVIAVVLWCTQEYNAAAHAPKMTPFTMLTIGPRRGEELWDLAAEQMAEVTERLDRLLERQMVRHHAYQIQQVHPLTTSYVTRSVATAVQMAFSIIEELQHHPIDDPVRRLLGDEGSLLMSYAVHWCTDATVRVESLEGSYRYEGPDVVFGGRMWAFAAPGVVTASEAVVQALTRCGIPGVLAHPFRIVSVQTQRAVSDGAEASASVRTARTLPLYLLSSAANPSTTVAAARVTETMEPAMRTDNAQSPTHPYGLILRASSCTMGTGASGMVQDVAAQSVASVCPASTAWDPVGVMQTSAAITSKSQARKKIALQRGPGTASSSVHSALSTEPPALGQSSRTIKCKMPPQAKRSSLVQIEADSVTHALLQPLIPQSLDIALHTAFSQQFIALEVQYSEVRVLVYYFYVSYKILFRPLAAPERHNIFRRLVTAFGVPQQRILEHLAAHGAVQWLSDVRKINILMHQRSSIDHSHSSSTSTTSSSCSSPVIGQQRHF